MKQPKVLIVDDDAVNRKLIASLLEDNYRITEANTGEEALGLVNSLQPDIVLLDNVMPGISGIEVCKTIRKNPEYNNTKILLISGKTSISERLTGYQAGADDYIGKPFDNDELIAKIRVYARLKQQEELNQLKTNFLTLVNHETGTPLTAVIALSEMLLDDKGLSEHQRNCISEIRDAGQMLNHKIERILLLSSLKQKNNFVKHKIFVDDLVQYALLALKHEISQRHVQIDFRKCPEACIWGDYNHLQKAVVFVIENAIRFSPKNSRIEVNVVINKNNCEIQVVDNGPGLPEGDVQKLFGEFGTTHSQKHNAGLGISLALSKTIMDLHDATISAENRTDGIRGAVFTLTWPFYDDSATNGKSAHAVN